MYIIFIRHLIIYSPGIKEKHVFVTASRGKHIRQLHYIICDTTLYIFFFCDFALHSERCSTISTLMSTSDKDIAAFSDDYN